MPQLLVDVICSRAKGNNTLGLSVRRRKHLRGIRIFKEAALAQMASGGRSRPGRRQGPLVPLKEHLAGIVRWLLIDERLVRKHVKVSNESLPVERRLCCHDIECFEGDCGSDQQLCVLLAHAFRNQSFICLSRLRRLVVPQLNSDRLKEDCLHLPIVLRLFGLHSRVFLVVWGRIKEEVQSVLSTQRLPKNALFHIDESTRETEDTD